MEDGVKHTAAERSRPDTDVAIVGMACRFPGANSLDAYWDVLSQGRCVVRELPPDRWDVDKFYAADANAPGKINARQAGYIDRPDLFDASFFGISPREARRMDPQQRMLLEVSWHALEDADIVPATLAGTHTGVFIGIMGCEWGGIQLTDIKGVDSLTGPGSGYCITPNRVSYHFDFNGPSIGYDTACSSSLVAISAAVQSLRLKECPVALAGGVNLVMLPGMNLFYTKAGLSASDGTCKPFSKHADGLGRSEGVGVVVLKLLSEAQASGDRIYAIIRGGAVNQDGRSNGLTAPSRWGQEDVLRLAFRAADVEPQEIQYIEAHGTGTVLGDLIEARGLGGVMADVRPADDPCYLGSVKGNMSHLEGAAGVAGVIKLALSIKNGKIPPSLHSAELNPDIPFRDYRLLVPQTLMDWPSSTGRPRFGGVSSFGIGGTNVHLVLMGAPDNAGVEPAQAHEPEKASRPAVSSPPTATTAPIASALPAVLTFSAKSEGALRAYAAQLDAYLGQHPRSDLTDLCRSSNLYRSHFPVRAAGTVVTAPRLRQELRSYARTGRATGGLVLGTAKRKPPKIAFVFTGQGSQYVGMGQALYRREPVFRGVIDGSTASFERLTGESLQRVLFEDSGLLERARFVQPAMYAFGYALARLWDSWGVRPSVVFGHSLGEYAAASVAGQFSFDDGLALVAKRGALMENLQGRGGMLVVFAEASKVESVLRATGSEFVVAADNAPGICAVSGPLSELDQVQSRLIRDGYRVKALSVSHAFHSPQMDGMLADFEAFADSIAIARSPTSAPEEVGVLSNVSGQLVARATQLRGADWVAQVRKPVRFRQCVEQAHAHGCHVFLEIGPARVLGPLVEATLGRRAHSIASLDTKCDDGEALCNAVARLHCLGVSIDFRAQTAATAGAKLARRVALPKYPFQQKSYWLDVTGEHREPAWLHAPRPGSDGAAAGRLDQVTEPAQPLGKATAPQMVGEAAETGGIVKLISAAVAQVCGADIAAIKPETLLVEELGFSSLMVTDLINALGANVPELASVPMSFFFEGASVADLLERCRDAPEDDPSEAGPGARFETDATTLQQAVMRCETWAKESQPGVVTRVPMHWVHQHREGNVLLARQELLSPTMVIGEATQDMTHSFFYDHAQDHVPGMYIIESVRQLITASAHAYFGVSQENRFVLTDLDIQFIRFADTDRAFFMALDNGKSLFEDGTMTFINSVTHIVQNESVIGTVHGRGRVMALSKYQGTRNDSRSEVGTAGKAPAAEKAEAVEAAQ